MVLRCHSLCRSPFGDCEVQVPLHWQVPLTFSYGFEKHEEYPSQVVNQLVIIIPRPIGLQYCWSPVTGHRPRAHGLLTCVVCHFNGLLFTILSNRYGQLPR